MARIDLGGTDQEMGEVTLAAKPACEHEMKRDLQEAEARPSGEAAPPARACGESDVSRPFVNQ